MAMLGASIYRVTYLVARTNAINLMSNEVETQKRHIFTFYLLRTDRHEEWEELTFQFGGEWTVFS